MEITASLVKQLREQTGAGIMDCKSALAESQGDLAGAAKILRTKGLSKAAKKSGRATGEGAVGSYIHAGGKIGVIVEVNCETDFVARTDDFQLLVKDLCLHVAASSPRFVSREDVDQDTLAGEKEILMAQARASGKPDNIVEKIAQGRLEKWYEEFCLLEQPFVRDPDQSVQDRVTQAVAKLGENIRVSRFCRFAVGETPAGATDGGAS
jgi:elongation factor Ts